jgi:autotransporter-associated beta strand protein
MKFVSLVSLLGLSTLTATAQEIIKAGNANSFHLTSSWIGGVVPTESHVAVWNSSSSGTFNTSGALGAYHSWRGIRIDGFINTSGTYNITGTQTQVLTLGSAGISLTGNMLLTLSHPLSFSADSILQLNTDGKGITFNNPVNLGGHTLTMISGHENRFINGTGPISNGTLRFSSGPHNGRAQFNAASTGPFNLLGTGSSWVILNHPSVSNPQLDVHLTDASLLSLGSSLDNLTVSIGNLSGSPGAAITPNYAAAPGNPAVVRTLSVNQTTEGTFAGGLYNSNNNRSLGFTKSGSATLTLTNPLHIYSGPTTVESGILKITGESSLSLRPDNTTPVTIGLHAGSVIINNGTFHYDSSISQIINGSFSGAGTLLKTKAGFLTLNGDGSGFSGQADVQQGRLILQNAFNGHVSLASGTSLAGAGAGNGTLTTASDTTLVLTGGATTTARSFNGVTLNGPTYFEFLTAPTGGTIYEVIRYGEAGITNPHHLQPRARGVLSDDTANQKLVFTAEPAGVRTWNTGDGVWNNEGLLTHWSGGDQVYMQGDQVTFGAIGTDTTITLGSLLSPSLLTVSNPSNTYRFIGNGGLTGTGIINKNSTGILEVGTQNPDFKGTLNINGGIFRLIEGGFWSVSTINNNAALEIDGSTDFTFLGNVAGTGTFTKRGSSTVTIGGGPNDLLSNAVIYNSAKVNENTFTGNVMVESGCLKLNKPTALGISLDGAKTVTVMNGGQIDFNAFASTGRDNRFRNRTYSFKIAGAGPDGTGALVNHRYGLGQFVGVLNLELTADATVGGTANFSAGYYDLGSTPALKGVITGNGHTLTKVGPDQVALSAPASNLTLIVKEGTLRGDGNSACFGGASGSVTVHSGATLRARGSIYNPVSEPGPMVIATPVTFHDGANLRSDESGTIHWAGPITLGGILNVYISASDHSMTGTVSGSGGLVKAGPSTLTLTAFNSYTGPTTVDQGTIVIQHPYLSNTAAVTVATGAILNLDFNSTDRIGSLTLGGVSMPPGTYSATTHPLLLAGAGSLQVVDAADYDNWSGSSGFNLNGGPDDDDDSDGLTNFEEYAFGLDPTVAASLSPVTLPNRISGTFTYTRRKPMLTGLNYTYAFSHTMEGWQAFTPTVPDVSDSGNPVESITVTIPAALLAEPRVFLRVKASAH